MRPGRFRALIEGLLHVPLNERDQYFANEVGRDLFQLRDRPPEARLTVATTRAGYELDSRAKLIFRAATYTLEHAGVGPELTVAEEARAVVRELIEAQPERLVEELRARFGDAADTAAEPLTRKASDHAKNFEAQVELFVAERPGPQHRTVTRAPNMFNFHGPVGAVQTGDGAVAQVTQVNAPPEVLQALQQIAAYFNSLDTEEGREAVAVVDAMKADIESPTRNRLRLAGLATALGGTVQTVADLQPAYTAIKAFLKTLGIGLP